VYAKKIDEHLGELAYHFLEAGDKDKALDYFLKAGEKAQKVYAHDEVFSYLQHAFELLEEKGDNFESKARITESLGDVKAWTGNFDACMEYWNKSLGLWNLLGDKKSVSRLHVKMARELWDVAGDKERASEHHRAALDILEKEPESVELATLYEDIEHMLWRTGELTKPLSYVQKALQLSEKLGNSEILAESYNDLGALSWASGEHDKALEYSKQGLKIAIENNCIKATLRLYVNLGSYYLWTGDFQKAFETAQAGFDLAKKVGEMFELSFLGCSLGECYFAMGEIQRSFSLFEEELALSKRMKDTTGIANNLVNLGWGYELLGEWEKSLQYLMEAYDIAKKTEEYVRSFFCTLWLGELFKEMDDYAESEKYLKECCSMCEKTGAIDSQIRWVFPALSKLYLKKGETEKAKELSEKNYEYAYKTKNKLIIAEAEMVKAMVFREQENWEQSIQHFEKSLQQHKTLNTQKWDVWSFAELLYEYGIMYLNRNQEGDKEKAYSLLNQALQIYQKTDAKKRIEKIIAKKKLLSA